MDGKQLIPSVRIAADSVAFLGAFGTSYALRQWSPLQSLRFPIQPLPFYFPLLPFALALLLGLFWQHGLYTRPEPPATISALTKVVRAVALWVAFLMAASYLSQLDPSRALILLLGILTLAGVTLIRSGIQPLERSLLRTSPERVLMIVGPRDNGDGPFASPPNATHTVVGLVELHRTPGPAGTINNLPSLLRETGATMVSVSDQSLSRDAVLNTVASAGDFAIHFRVPLNVFPLLRGNAPVRDLEAEHVTLDLGARARGAWVRFGKRAVDVVAPLVILPLAVPIGCAIACAIWLDSGRPILFPHERIGVKSRRFRMLKFRTMVAGTPALADAPRTPDDERVTRVGRWLRRWSLDELPQLWNVFSGDMSLVGPRPEMPHLVARYAPWQQMRLWVRPGLTGLWQVLGRKEHPLHEHLEYDVYYVHNVCASLDLAILLKTLPRIIGGRGAY